jgi:hypothetical protein
MPHILCLSLPACAHRSNRKRTNGKPLDQCAFGDALRKKTTFPFYSPFFETPPSYERGDKHSVKQSLGGWE